MYYLTSTSNPPNTARTFTNVDYIATQMPTSSVSSLSSQQLMQNLSASISHYRNNLSEFQNYVKSSLQGNMAIKSKCSEVLQISLASLKENFQYFAHEWKVELPLICKQFMEIMRKICTLYQQEVDRLSEVNEKWEFSYKQLLKATNIGKKNTTDIQLPQKFIGKQELEKQVPKPKGNQNIFLKTMSKSELISNLQSYKSTNIQQYLQKIKDSELSVLKQQITQLFEQEESSYREQPHLHKFMHELEEENTNKLNFKMLKEEDKLKDEEEVREFRMKTYNDEKNSKNNMFISLNTLPNASTCVNKETKQKDILKQSFKNCNSQQNSRKNSLVMKEQFWHTLRNNISISKSMQLNKSSTNVMGKENTSNSIKQKERDKIAGHSISTEWKDGDKSNGYTGGSGSRLQNLKKNMYKNKNPVELRF